MSELLTLFGLGVPVQQKVVEGEKANVATHAAYMRQTYGYAQAGLTCGQCKHFSQEKRTIKKERIDGGNVYKETELAGGCFHYTGGRVQSWKPDAAGCRLWEGK